MKLKNHHEIITEDGSTTLFSQEYNEACHSTAGAAHETIIHYINGCKITELIKDHKEINVLEVGFGAGIGFLKTLECTQNSSAKLKFTSFEIDKELIEYFFYTHNYDFTLQDNIYSYVTDSFELNILLGDARKSVKKLSNQKFHAIYQDAFSPRRNSILWTTEWFIDLLALADSKCIMSTYSASSSIRKSMISAGWKLYAGERFGNKRASTRARIYGETDSEITEHLNRSPAVEITDENYNHYTLEDRNEKN